MKKKKDNIVFMSDGLVAILDERVRFIKALGEISTMGDGIRSDQIDWANIGRNSKYLATKALGKAETAARIR